MKLFCKSHTFLIALVLASCERPEPEPIPDFTIFKIAAGEHNSTSMFEVFPGMEMNFSAVFDSTAIYYTADPINQSDINKLYGLSDCNSHHQVNSARFGWRWYNSQLQILAYVYLNGVKHEQFITSVELNKEYAYRLKLVNNTYEFSVNDVKISMPRNCSDDGSTKYKLYPYFGGDEPASHEITIKIRVFDF